MRAGYIWIVYGWWSQDWYKQEDETIECTSDEMTQAVSSTNMLIVDWKQLSTREEPTVANLVSMILCMSYEVMDSIWT